jgi:hypothetical protein
MNSFSPYNFLLRSAIAKGAEARRTGKNEPNFKTVKKIEIRMAKNGGNKTDEE